MRIDILTLFPEVINSYIFCSIIKKAQESNLVNINVYNYRDYSLSKNKRVDDYSYGGGAGMIIGVQPIVDCLKDIPNYHNALKIITKPTGITFNQRLASDLSKESHLIIVCGHYEGIDERISNYIDCEISVGDYILTGGEIPSLVILDSVTRLLSEVLGNSSSIEIESFENHLLEYPQYTRPVNFEGFTVPDVLLSGNHLEISNYRRFKSLELTYHKRKDLLEKAILTKKDLEYLERIKKGLDYED